MAGVELDQACSRDRVRPPTGEYVNVALLTVNLVTLASLYPWRRAAAA